MSQMNGNCRAAKSFIQEGQTSSSVRKRDYLRGQFIWVLSQSFWTAFISPLNVRRLHEAGVCWMRSRLCGLHQWKVCLWFLGFSGSHVLNVTHEVDACVLGYQDEFLQPAAIRYLCRLRLAAVLHDDGARHDRNTTWLTIHHHNHKTTKSVWLLHLVKFSVLFFLETFCDYQLFWSRLNTYILYHQIKYRVICFSFDWTWIYNKPLRVMFIYDYIHVNYVSLQVVLQLIWLLIINKQLNKWSRWLAQPEKETTDIFWDYW